jgi:Transposase zinc-ribbon domain
VTPPESIGWPDGPVCPHCGVIGNHYELEGPENVQHALVIFGRRSMVNLGRHPLCKLPTGLESSSPRCLSSLPITFGAQAPH